MSLAPHSRLKHSPNATFQTVAADTILIHLQTGTYYSLDEVGTVFWNLLDGQKTVGECATAIASEYAAPVEAITTDLLEVAGELFKEGLLENA